MAHTSVTQSAEWNEARRGHEPRSGAFLQTWEWGTFQESRGRTVKRYIAHEGEMLAQIIEMSLPLGMRYGYCPRGPLVKASRFDANMAVDTLRDIARERGELFMRFDPPVESATAVHWNGVRHTLEIQPADTLIMDLTRGRDALFGQMHGKTRYNIRVAQRKEVEIQMDAQVSFDAVWKLFQQTASRGAFHLHSRAYYHDMLRYLNTSECRAFLATAKYKGELIAANVMIDCGKTRTYLHGASSDDHRNVMAPFLLHWSLIQDAQDKGMTAYDWWGVAPPGAGEGHPWAGITRFKMGFGGEYVAYPGTFDLPLKPAIYQAYMMARKAVRAIR